MNSIAQQIKDLKIKRAEEWKKGKFNRDDNIIQEAHNRINDLKKQING